MIPQRSFSNLKAKYYPGTQTTASNHTHPYHPPTQPPLSSTSPNHQITPAPSLGNGLRSRSVTASGLNHKEELVAVKQFSKRPIHPSSHPCQSLKWFCTVNKKVGINRRNDPTRIFRFKETATELSVFDIADWRCFHDSFRVAANEANGHRATPCPKFSVNVTIWSRTLVYPLLPNALAAAGGNS